MSLTRQEVCKALGNGEDVQYSHIEDKSIWYDLLDGCFHLLDEPNISNRDWRIKPRPADEVRL